MYLGKLTVAACVAASCAGCVTETKSVPASAETIGKIKGIKEVDYPKRQALPTTWIAIGELDESKANELKASPADQSALRDDARKAYLKALEIDAKCIPAYVHLANLFMLLDDPERAIAVYQRGLQQNPKCAQLWLEQGLVYCKRKDFAPALECLAKAHELDPDNHHCATQYGLCLARAGRPQEAVTVLCCVMNKAEANYNVARMMAHIQQQELSRQYLQAALAERPTHAGSLALIAELDGARPGQAPAVANVQGQAPVARVSFNSPE